MSSDDKLRAAIIRYEKSIIDLKKTRIESVAKIRLLIAEINAIIKFQMCSDMSNNGHAIFASEGAKHTNNIFAGGKVRVGRIRGQHEPGHKYPVTDGYTNIIVTSHNQKGLGHSLSPYVVCDEKGRIMENLWQFAKIYPQVHEQTQPEWSWPEEVHIESEDKPVVPTEDYWLWRKSGMEHEKPVRYPNGFKGRAECVCVLWPKDGMDHIYDSTPGKMQELGYIESRKKVYCRLYTHLVRNNPEFKKLRQMLDEGINLQILDVDGPDVEKATKKIGGRTVIKEPYDKMTKGVYGATSGVGSIEITEHNIKLLMDDADQPFGHGYVLACLLLDKMQWL